MEQHPRGNDFCWDFDFPDRYEREKATRIMPGDLKPLELYILRVKMPPGAKPFAAEFVSALVWNPRKREDGHYDIKYVWRPVPDSTQPEPVEAIFNAKGYMLIFNDGSMPGLPEEIEMAYFVGSTDPYDLELAELVSRAQELSGV